MPGHEAFEVDPSIKVSETAASENVSPHPNHPDQKLTPTILEKTKSSVTITLARIDKKVSAVFSIVGKVFIAGVILLAIVFIIRQLSSTGYAIRHVNMPVSFQDAGYTGPVVADRITSNLKTMLERVKLNSVEFIDPSSEADVSVDLVGVGVPVRAAVSMVGEALGLDQAKTITTDFTIDGDTLIVRITLTGENPEQFKFQMKGGKDAVLKKAIDQASFSILKYTAPDILGLYLSTYENHPVAIIELAKFILERHKGDPYYEARAYTDWAGALVTQGKLEAASKMLDESLKKYQTTGLYAALGALRIARGDDMNSVLATDKKCLELSSSPRSRATACSNIGYDFTMLKQSDSAIHYYKKAIEFDPDLAIAYYNIGIDYLLLKADTAKFFDYFEQALAKDISVKVIASDPDFQQISTDPRVKSLLEQYAE